MLESAGGENTFVCVCDSCDRQTASVFCMSDGAFLCQSCDVEIHSNRIAMRHLRMPYTQCPVWAYREAKSKGRLREGVAGPAHACSQDHALQQQSAQPQRWGSLPSSARLLAPQQTPPGWFQDENPVMSDHPNTLRVPRRNTSSSAIAFNALQQQLPVDTGSASSLRTSRGEMEQLGGSLPVPMPWATSFGALNSMGQKSQHLPSRGTDPANPQAGPGPSNNNTAHPLNHNLVSLMEEFKLPDGTQDNLLLDLPPSPPSVMQGSGSAHQQHLYNNLSSQAIEVRQLPNSLKSSYTALATSVPEFDGRSQALYSSPGSHSILGSSLQHQQQQQSSNLADVHMAQQSMQCPQQFGRVSSLTMGLNPLSYSQAHDNHSSAAATASTSGAAQQQQQQQQGGAFNISRSNPVPIGGGLAGGIRKVMASSAHAPPESGMFMRGMAVPASADDDRSHSFMAPPGSSASELGSLRASLAIGVTPDSSQHGGSHYYQGGSVHGGTVHGGRGGAAISSMDEAALAAALGSAVSLPSTLPSSLLASMHLAGTPSRADSVGAAGGGPAVNPVSLLIETASAASIEARARALINSSSRTQEPRVFDPRMVMRIERPDGTIRELDPERAAQLHRYRQKRLARMKAYTEGQKKIRYECRKQLADSRPRVRGRFAKVGSFENLSSLLAEHSVSLGVGDGSMRGASSYAELMQTQRIDEDAMYDMITQVGGSLHGGQAGGGRGGRDLGGLLRRAVSCSHVAISDLLRPSVRGPPASPGAGGGGGGSRSNRSSLAGHDQHHGGTHHVHHGSAPHTSVTLTASTPPASSAPSADSPCLGSTGRMTPQLHQDMAGMGSDLDAAIAAACEQECMTVTDQELAALGFAPMQQQKSPRTQSEGSAESMSTNTANPQRQSPAHQSNSLNNDHDKHNQQMNLNQLNHDLLHHVHQAQQGAGSMSVLMGRISSPFQEMSMGHHHTQQQQHHHHLGSQMLPFPRDSLMMIDGYPVGEFADQQVSSMLDELLQEQGVSEFGL